MREGKGKEGGSEDTTVKEQGRGRADRKESKAEETNIYELHIKV